MGRLFVCALGASILAGAAHAQGYTNVAPAQGLDFTVAVTSPADFGTGVSFRDIDGDGWDDVTFANVNDSLIVYRNNEGTLERMSSPAFAEGNTRAVLWADIDNDGLDDLLVTTFMGKVKLYRNLGNWQFEDITATSGLVQDDGNRWGASFGDFNKDGFLDLYTCTYIYGESSYAYSRLNHLYQNNGDGTFTDVTLQAGVGDGLKASFQSVWMDVDMDGWPDLFVINDFEPSNSMYRNNGDGTFTEMAMALGMDMPGEHCMSISMCDFDLDGDLDIYITNTGVFLQTNSARHMLLLNNGDGTYTESSTLYGLDVFEWGWGALWVDHDNDGYQDLYIATHRELALPVPNLFFKNNNGLGFSDADDLFPDPQITSSHSVARGDLDRDGYADIVVQNQHPFPPYLWKNNGGSANHVRITLEGTVSNRMAIGSWIKVYAGGKQYIHYTVCGENYLSQNSQHILFGLGSAPVVDSVVVEYLSGHVDRYYDLPVNSEYHFLEGETFQPVISPNGPLVACAPNTVVLDAGEYPSYLWNTGYNGRYLNVAVSGTYFVTVSNEFGIQANSLYVVVTIGPAPAVFAESSDPICAGEATGSIVLENLSGVAVQSVAWSNGASGMHLQGLEEGSYSYNLTDVNGCTATGAVELLDPDPLFVLVSYEDATPSSGGSISWFIFGGVPPYTVLLNDEDVAGGEVEDLASGIYSLEIKDAHDCGYDEEVIIQSITGVDERSAVTVSLYPNPATDVLYIQSPITIVGAEIFDARGRSVAKQYSATGIAQLKLSPLAGGSYLVALHSGDGQVFRSVVTKLDR